MQSTTWRGRSPQRVEDLVKEGRFCNSVTIGDGERQLPHCVEAGSNKGCMQAGWRTPAGKQVREVGSVI